MRTTKITNITVHESEDFSLKDVSILDVFTKYSRYNDVSVNVIDYIHKFLHNFITCEYKDIIVRAAKEYLRTMYEKVLDEEVLDDVILDKLLDHYYKIVSYLDTYAVELLNKSDFMKKTYDLLLTVCNDISYADRIREPLSLYLKDKTKGLQNSEVEYILQNGFVRLPSYADFGIRCISSLFDIDNDSYLTITKNRNDNIESLIEDAITNPIDSTNIDIFEFISCYIKGGIRDNVVTDILYRVTNKMFTQLNKLISSIIIGFIEEHKIEGLGGVTTTVYQKIDSDDLYIILSLGYLYGMFVRYADFIHSDTLLTDLKGYSRCLNKYDNINLDSKIHSITKLNIKLWKDIFDTRLIKNHNIAGLTGVEETLQHLLDIFNTESGVTAAGDGYDYNQFIKRISDGVDEYIELKKLYTIYPYIDRTASLLNTFVNMQVSMSMSAQCELSSSDGVEWLNNIVVSVDIPLTYVVGSGIEDNNKPIKSVCDITGNRLSCLILKQYECLGDSLKLDKNKQLNDVVENSLNKHLGNIESSLTALNLSLLRRVLVDRSVIDMNIKDIVLYVDDILTSEMSQKLYDLNKSVDILYDIDNIIPRNGTAYNKYDQYCDKISLIIGEDVLSNNTMKCVGDIAKVSPFTVWGMNSNCEYSLPYEDTPSYTGTTFILNDIVGDMVYNDSFISLCDNKCSLFILNSVLGAMEYDSNPFVGLFMDKYNKIKQIEEKSETGLKYTEKIQNIGYFLLDDIIKNLEDAANARLAIIIQMSHGGTKYYYDVDELHTKRSRYSCFFNPHKKSIIYSDTLRRIFKQTRNVIYLAGSCMCGGLFNYGFNCFEKLDSKCPHVHDGWVTDEPSPRTRNMLVNFSDNTDSETLGSKLMFLVMCMNKDDSYQLWVDRYNNLISNSKQIVISSIKKLALDLLDYSETDLHPDVVTGARDFINDSDPLKRMSETHLFTNTQFINNGFINMFLSYMFGIEFKEITKWIESDVGVERWDYKPGCGVSWIRLRRILAVANAIFLKLMEVSKEKNISPEQAVLEFNADYFINTEGSSWNIWNTFNQCWNLSYKFGSEYFFVAHDPDSDLIKIFTEFLCNIIAKIVTTIENTITDGNPDWTNPKFLNDLKSAFKWTLGPSMSEILTSMGLFLIVDYSDIIMLYIFEMMHDYPEFIQMHGSKSFMLNKVLTIHR